MGERATWPRRGARCGALLAPALLALLAPALPALLASAAVGGRAGGSGVPLTDPYSGAPFTVQENRYAFGQAASWVQGDQVLSGQPDRDGISQIYRSHLDGSDQRCLTCTTVAGPNAFPQPRPQGDVILFDSDGDQPVHTGNPGFGGSGGDLDVMRADGSHPSRLTTGSDPDDGAPSTGSSGTPSDNFHAS
jgi:hypothetical protein